MPAQWGAAVLWTCVCIGLAGSAVVVSQETKESMGPRSIKKRSTNSADSAFESCLPTSHPDRMTRPKKGSADPLPDYGPDYLDVRSPFWQRKTNCVFGPRSYQLACLELRDLLNPRRSKRKKGSPVPAGP